MTRKIDIERCCCGFELCPDYWLTGIGRFTQGSGFKKAEAETLKEIMNAIVLMAEARAAYEETPESESPRIFDDVDLWRANADAEIDLNFAIDRLTDPRDPRPIFERLPSVAPEHS